MKPVWCYLMMGSLFVSIAMIGQTTPAINSDGKQAGGYQIQQSVEFGYRFTDVTGNDAMYETLIDQHEGPRLLDQSLSMRSVGNTGLLFDELTVNSFGWGGDPENVARARVSKFKAYDFTFQFRRDHNYFDYDLLANPLNPPTSNPAVPVNFSPHSFYNTRRMYDFDLSVLPQSKVSFRVGMTHNRSDGPTFSSIHEGSDYLLYQGWNVTDNLYRFGADFKILPKTVISYDQFLDYGKNDTDYSLATFATDLLPNGTSVELGLPWNTTAGSPCATPFRNGAVNPSCNGAFSYLRNQKVRSTTPTEQLRVVSDYFHRVNFIAQGTYSNTDLTTPYLEMFDGLTTRTGERQNTFSGPATTRRVNATADLGLTVEVTKSIRISENFRYDNWHLPGLWESTSTSTRGVPVGTPPAVTLLSPLGTTTTTPTDFASFLGMRSFYNLIQIEYNPDKYVGLRAGYKIRNRRVAHADPESLDPEDIFEPFEFDMISVNQQGPVFGVWWRPITNLRINLEAEALTTIGCQAACSDADMIFITRISPKQQQNYRGRVTYKPVRWADLSGSVNWWEARNGEVDTQFNQHYRNAGFALSLFPNNRVSLDLSYNYTDSLQDAYICYTGTFTAPGTVVNGCPTYDPTNTSANPNPNSIYSTYVNNTHYFSGTVLLHPVKRLTTNIGYGLIKTDGNETILNPLQPLGPLQFTYHQPLASVSYEVVKDWSLNAYWNYDQYNEGSFAGPTLPRSFHDNRTVLSVRYAF
ncbi:MAG TPA: hypothetical protein VG897_17390 [Terriglobales bacterium]|nr:hypothetical protein [Terriglobales bacterium]